MVTRRWSESDEAKSSYVKEVFSALAPRYNVMTDVWTFGLHRVWKRQAMELCALRPGERVLDVATGTGDLAFLEEAVVGPEGQVVAVDSCAAMLEVARGRQRGAIDFQEGDAMGLRFPDASFDVVTIGFGLRNVADRGQALREFRRVLCPGGRLMVASSPAVATGVGAVRCDNCLEIQIDRNLTSSEKVNSSRCGR